MARKITVDIVGDAQKFSRSLKEATTQATTFQGKLGAVGKGVAIGAGVASFNLLTNAISLGVSKLDEMHQAFLDDEASQVRLQNVLQNTVSNFADATKEAEKFAAAQANLGFEDDDVRDSIAQLVGQTHDLAEATRLVSLAQDLARAKNIDLAQATDVITKAYNGQARGLAAHGVNVQGAVGGTELLARAYDNVRGAAQRYATTANGRVAAANVKMQETMEKVGGAIDKVSQVVIPIMVAGLGGIVDFIGETIKAVSDLTSWLTNNLAPAFQFVADAIANAAGFLGQFGDIAKTIANGIVPGSVGGGGGTNPNGSPLPPGVTVTKYPPFHHDGGIVAGPYGSDQLIMAQAGERIIPTGQANAGQTININIASFIGSDRDIDRFADRLAFRLRATSLS